MPGGCSASGLCIDQANRHTAIRQPCPSENAPIRCRGVHPVRHAGGFARKPQVPASIRILPLQTGSQRLCGRGMLSLQHRRQPVSVGVPLDAVQRSVSSAVGHTAQQRAATAVFGSMMRTVLRGSPRMLLRTLLRTGTRLLRPLLSGPGSVFVLLFTILGGIVAAVGARIRSTCRNCNKCHGFGIERCSLCRGVGSVGWEGKWSHSELCPSCLGKRFVNCPECGGHFHRATFVHARHRGRQEALESLDGGDDEDDRFLERMVAD